MPPRSATLLVGLEGHFLVWLDNDEAFAFEEHLERLAAASAE